MIPWQPTHIATFASSDFGLAGIPAGWPPEAVAAVAPGAPAGAVAGGVCVTARLAAQATQRAKSVVHNLFILRAPSGEGHFFSINGRLWGGAPRRPSPPNP